MPSLSKATMFSSVGAKCDKGTSSGGQSRPPPDLPWLSLRRVGLRLLGSLEGWHAWDPRPPRILETNVSSHLSPAAAGWWRPRSQWVLRQCDGHRLGRKPSSFSDGLAACRREARATCQCQVVPAQNPSIVYSSFFQSAKQNNDNFSS